MLRAFFRTPGAIVGLTVIGALIVIAIVAPILWTTQADALGIAQVNQPPSWQYPLGTDQLGRDIFLRILVATRLSLGLAFAAAGLGALLGIPAGVGASVLPGRARSAALRVIDTLLAFPGILIAIFVGAIVGAGAFGATLGVGIASSFFFARVASSLAMSVGGQEYIAAARVVGVKRRRLILRYLLPNIAETLLITTTVAISSSIVQVSSLSFLGLGVQPPKYDWGRMLTDGVQAIYLNPVEALAPAAAIAISALAFGFTGEALARAMNPVLWGTTGSTGPKPPETVTISPANGRTPVQQEPAGARLPVDLPQMALEVRDLVVEFPDNGTPLRVVDGVTFTLRKGEVLGIVGESGSGKTMTAMAIAQLLPHPAIATGKAVLDGHDLLGMRHRELNKILGSRLAVVFQNPMSSLNPAMRIGRQLTESVQVHHRMGGSDASELAESRLAEVNIPTPHAQLRRYPHELSGGMRQRVMIAMGLMKEPTVLIADEPTTALDVTIQAQIMELLFRVNRDHNTAIILISHNLALVSQNCERVLVMYAGRIVEDLSIGQLRGRPLHPYTQALSAAVPDLGRPRTEALATIAGQVPDAASRPSGCPYHPRCPLAVAKCTVEVPQLTPFADGQRVACWVASGDTA